MPIIVRLDVMLARRKIRSKALAQAVGITEANLSLLKSGKVKGLTLLHLGGNLRVSRLPAGRHPGVRAGPT